MIPSDGLERLLKGLEGHVVDSVEIEREKGCLHVKMSVIGLDERHPITDILGSAALGSTDVSFSVVWKKTLDRMLDELDRKLTKASSKLTKEVSVLGEAVEDLKKAVEG